MNKLSTKFSFLILLALLMPFIAAAQKKSEADMLLSQAGKEYKDLKYAVTIQLLNEFIKTDSQNVSAKEMLANSYRKVKDYKNAKYWFSELSKLDTVKAEWALYYAEALANNEEYTESETWYQKYLSLASSDSRASSFAKVYPEVSTFMKNKKLWKISYTDINTSAAEYSPAYYKNGLIFSSNRNTGKLIRHIFAWDQTPFTDLYFIKKLDSIRPLNIDSALSKAKADTLLRKKMYKVNDDDTYRTSNDSRVLTDYRMSFRNDTLSRIGITNGNVHPLDGKVNTKYHEGPSVVLPDGSLLFTRNNYNKGRASASKEGVNKLKLFTAAAPAWDVIKPFPYNSNEYSTGHPTINKDGTLLIFASDMPGGRGGVDLYYATRKDFTAEWNKPVNLGPQVNTEGDEMFPSIYQDSLLFFSSTGHAGLGGLDIFQVSIKDTTVLNKPLNLGAPVNSSVDDFGLIRSEDGRSGYFSSNRRGNDDIYTFNFHDFKIYFEGLVINGSTGQPMPGSTITVTSEAGVTELLHVDSAGVAKTMLSKESGYTLTAVKEDFDRKVAYTSTKGIEADSTIKVVFKMDKYVAPYIAPVFASPSISSCDSLKQILADCKIYYDLNKSFIRPDAVPIMDNLIALMKKYPQLSVNAASHCDSRASKSYNITLSLQRSASAKKYLTDHGIAPSRVTIQYYGESKLVNNCLDGVRCPEPEQQLNRRTEFHLTMNGVEVRKLGCDRMPNAAPALKGDSGAQ